MTLALHGKSRKRQGWLIAIAVAMLALATVAGGTLRPSESAQADSSAINFESYANGTINAQDGWSSTGAAGSGCAAYDHAVVTNGPGAPATFGTKSLRMSNAVTSGCFGDHTFSKSLLDEAGEETAQGGGMSGGARQTRFEAQWDFASTVPGAVQPGLSVVASPDRGDGARMSWVQMADTPGGLEVNFYDYQRTVGSFVFTNIASGLDRTVPHNIRIAMFLLEGPENDVVHVFVDGILQHTGTSWEDYFRDWQAPGTRTVDSILFRTGGTAVPATLGNGFLIDNLSLTSSTPPQCTTICYADAVTGNDGFGGASPTNAKRTIQAAVNQVIPNGTVHVAAGTYPEQVVIAKSITVTGAGASSTTIVAPTVMSASLFEMNIVEINSGATVDFSGFTVSGPGPGACGSIRGGIVVVEAAFATIHDNAIVDIRDQPISGCQNGQAIWVGRKAWSTTGSAVISNNVITGFQKGGIVVDNAGSSATIEGNTITGVGPTTLIAANGIQISRGATATIIGNTVSGNNYTPAAWEACGILFLDADGVKQSKNNMFDNEKNLCNAGRGGGQFNPVP